MQVEERNSVGVGARPNRRVALLAVIVLRIFAVLLSVEVSGCAHAALDLASSLSLIEHAEQHADDDEDHECPPGCMNCHCVHAALATSTLPIEVQFALVQPPPGERSSTPHTDLPLLNADLARLDRPPRSLS